MLHIIGNFLLLISIILSVCSLAIACVPERPNHNSILRYFTLSQTICATLSFFTLVIGFTISDFSIQNVFLNSSSIMPIIFKIAAAWASHEGSILMWYCFLNIIFLTCIMSRFIASNNDLLRTMTIIASPILFGFGSFIYSASNPFLKLHSNINQGMGLNPILQDIGLTIHPPILYIGYVTYFAPFIYACIALIKPDKALEAFRASMTYAKFGMLTLTIGVGLGSWWAYRELGWGGFWFFDPVENISLMPLICSIAFYHSLLFSTTHAKLFRWSIFLGITTFLLTLIGTFFVRSGMLISVHAFADASKRSSSLLIICLVIICLSYLLYLIKIRTITPSILLLKSKVYGVFLGNLLWVISIITILFSIIYPSIAGIFGKVFTVEIGYFIKTFLPITIPTALLAGSFAYFKPQQKMSIYAMLICVSMICTFIIIYNNNKTSWLMNFAICSSIFLMSSSIYKGLDKSHYFKVPLSNKMTAMLISHFGYGLMIFSISMNTLLKEDVDFIGQKGSTITTTKYNITLQNIIYDEGPNYYRQIVEFWIKDKNNEIVILRPENRLYKIEKAITAESDIYSSLSHDTYAVLNRIDSNTVHAQIYHRPFIGLLWISLVMIAGGMLISLFTQQSTPKHKI